MDITFRATETRVKVEEAPPRWRALDFALIAGSCGLMAWKGMSLTGRVKAMPRRLIWAAPLLLAAGNRRFITVECLRMGFYPVRGYMGLRSPAWNQHEGIKIEATDGNVLGAHLLKSEKRNGKVVLINSGNFFCYEWMHPRLFDSLREQGYDVMLYNPPGYGNSTGSRWMQSDLYGADAVMQHLLHEGYAENQVTVIGTSIGSGSSCEVAKNYDLDHLYLMVPFNDLNSVIKRLLPRPIHWITRRDVAEYFDYRNGEKLEGRDNVTVIEAAEDQMMTLGDESTEAEKLGKTTHSMAGVNHYFALSCFDYEAVFNQNFDDVRYAVNLLGQDPS